VQHGVDAFPTARLREQGAGQILQNVGAEGYAVLPPGQADFEAGAEVELELFDRPHFVAVDA
jgi:molybdopterin molybdotransferase